MDITKIKGHIGIIDNDLLERPLHNFPNLALMKISSYLKNKGNTTKLITSWREVGGFFGYDYYILSKVFSDTKTPKTILNNAKIIYGGSGFFYDKAPTLPYEIEHRMPDYNLYNNTHVGKIGYYTNHSIGFTTRGCIRQCEFCINRNSKKVEKHSSLLEFLNTNKPFITLLDDNITAYTKFNYVWKELQETQKPFTFKQGLDFRLLNEKRILLMADTKNYGKTDKISQITYYFAFDNISDFKRINIVMQIWNANMKRSIATWMYCITGFDRNNKYDADFFIKDYEDLIFRIDYLYRSRIRPYIMIHEKLKMSPFYKKILLLKSFTNSPINCTNRTFESFLKYKCKVSAIKNYKKELGFTYKY